MSAHGSVYNDDADALDFDAIDDLDGIFNTDTRNRLASLLDSTNNSPSANSTDVRNFIRSYRLFMSIASVDGLPQKPSCIAPLLQSYFVDVEICKAKKKFELPISKRSYIRSNKDKEFTEKSIQSNIWNIADYHGIMEIKFKLISQRLLFKSVICSKTINISDLYNAQFGGCALTQGDSGDGDSSTGWLQDFEILIPVNQKKPRKSWRNWVPFFTPLSSQQPQSHTPRAAEWFPTALFGEKSKAAYNRSKNEPLLEKEFTSTPPIAAKSVDETKFVRIMISFRIIHSSKLLQLAPSTSYVLQPPSPSSSVYYRSTPSLLTPQQSKLSSSNSVSMSEFHFLCSCAPAAVVLEIMKGLAEVKLLPRCLQLRTQRRRPGTTEDETADLTYTPLDVALLCCNAPVVYDILRRAGSSCFQNLPTNKGNALHNAVRGGSFQCLTYVCKYLKEAHVKFREGSAYMRGSPTLTALFEWKDSEGKTPLALACSLPGRDVMVDLLLHYHAQAGAVNPKDNYTPLMYACVSGDAKTASRLLSVAKPPTSTGEGSFNALSLLACDPSYHEKSLYRQAIHLAAVEGHISIVESLVTAGVSILVTDRNEENIFHIAAKAGHTELFSKIADIEAKEWKAYKELLSSAGFFHRQRAMACLNLQGKYPAEMAFQAGHVALAALLVEQVERVYGCDVDDRDAGRSDMEISYSGFLQRRKTHQYTSRHLKVKDMILMYDEKEDDRKVYNPGEKLYHMDDNHFHSSGEKRVEDKESLLLCDEEADEQDYLFALTSLSLRKYIGEDILSSHSHSESKPDGLDNENMAEQKGTIRISDLTESKEEGVLREEK